MDDDDEAAGGAPAASTVLPHSPARSDDIFSENSPPPPAAAAAVSAPVPTAAPAAADGGSAGAQASAIPGKHNNVMTAGDVLPVCLFLQSCSKQANSCCHVLHAGSVTFQMPPPRLDSFPTGHTNHTPCADRTCRCIMTPGQHLTLCKSGLLLRSRAGAVAVGGAAAAGGGGLRLCGAARLPGRRPAAGRRRGGPAVARPQGALAPRQHNVLTSSAPGLCSAPLRPVADATPWDSHLRSDSVRVPSK
jgi:hypothetical protein